MKTRRQIGAALAGAALVVAGGSAYTAANTLTADPFMGDASNSVSGVTVTSTDFIYYDASGDTLKSIVYNVSDDLTTNGTTTATVTSSVGDVNQCNVAQSAITCNVYGTSLGWSVAGLTAIALSVQTSQTT
ncbi:MAG: hypothetical protein K0U64_11895 [Actinomycetia bacterium]|nr:hypothetical protein [Actinomycetes bacterium]